MDILSDFIKNADSLDSLSEELKEKLRKLLLEEERDIEKQLNAKAIIPCPHCGSIATVKGGYTAAGTQRYICKDCKKTFVSKTNTIFEKSRLSKQQWKELIKGMVSGLSLDKIARNVGVKTTAAWYNTQKIKSCLLEIFKDQDQFKGIVECDECFVHLSFKGKRDPDFFVNTLHRMPRHHRNKTEKIEYLVKNGLWDEVQLNPNFLASLLYGTAYIPGTNKDSISILTGKDIVGDLYLSPACVGGIESKHIREAFKGRFEEGSILVTDGSNAYTDFAGLENIHHIQIPSTEHARGPYSLAHVNALHSNLRDYWPKDGKNLPASKYLDLGLIFFWWKQKNKDLTQHQQVEEIWGYLQDFRGKLITRISLRYRPLPLDTKGIIPEYV